MRFFPRLTAPIIALVIVASCAASDLFAQPVLNGYAVGTCYSGANPGHFVMGLMDIRNANLQPLNANWMPPGSHGPTANWTATNLGEIFGIAFDAAGNFYVTATGVYAQSAPPNGPGGSGAIYKIDGVTGMITNWVTTVYSPCAAVNGTTTLPNDSVGLGNIAFDAAHNQFFVTNFEDGKIYRINMAGVVQDSFDPFSPDGCAAGIAPLGERVWGIGVYNDTVYFSRWVEDQGWGHYSAATANEIWSVALDGSGDFTGSEQLEISLPSLGGNQYSNPVSDIAFNGSGRMLLAERSMSGQSNNPLYPSAHQSRLLEYVETAGTWVPSSNTFSVGAYSVGNNSAGGCDYGYGSVDPNTRLPVDCDSAVWVSGDALHYAFGDYIYGFARIPASGGGAAQSVFIDADGDVTQVDKLQIGDIEVFKNCGIQSHDICDSIRVNAKAVQGADGSKMCCWELTITGITPGAFSSISGQLLSSGVAFTGVIGPSGWNVTNSGTMATWDSAGTIPGGTVTGLRFCMYSTVSPPELVEVSFHAADGTVCKDTVMFDCPAMPPPIPPCISLGDTTIDCQQSGPNGSTYDLSFTVTNNSAFSLPPYTLPAENVAAYPITGGVYVTPMLVPLSPTLGYGSTSGALHFTISGPNAVPGATVCIVVQIHGKKLQQDFQWCCPPDTLCITLPSCHDCCDSVDFLIRQTKFRQIGNGAANLTSSVTVTPGPIMSASATILSVNRSDQWCPKFVNGQWSYVNNGGGGAMAALITGAAISPSLPLNSGITPPTAQVSWGNVPAGVNYAGGSIGLQLAFPGSSLGWRCRDTIKVCVRYTFTDTLCRTCDTTVCYTLERTGTIEIIGHNGGPKLVTRLTDSPINGGLGPDGGQKADVEEAGPGLSIDMSGPTAGTLALAHWWQDDLPGEPQIELTSMSLTPEPGVEISSIKAQGGTASGNIVDHTATIGLDLRKGDTDKFDLSFRNPDGRGYFLMRAYFHYVDVADRKDTMVSREYVLAAVSTGDGGDIVDADAKTTRPVGVRTFMLYFVNANVLQRPIAQVDLTVSEEGVDNPQILAVGPPNGVTGRSVSMEVVENGSRKASHDVAMNAVRNLKAIAAPGDSIVPIFITIAGVADNPVKIGYTTQDEDGNTISMGEFTLTDPLKTSRVDDPSDRIVTGTGVELFPIVPNPGSGDRTIRFRLSGGAQSVTIALYDAAGREVTRLLTNEEFGAGEHTLIYPAAELPSGNYRLVVKTRSATVSEGMTVVN